MVTRRGLRPGWYPDPDVSDRFRWWNGRAWTTWLSATRDQGFPPPEGDEVVPVPTVRDKVAHGVWIGAAVVGLVMVVMAAAGVVTISVVRRRSPRSPILGPHPRPQP